MNKLLVLSPDGSVFSMEIILGRGGDGNFKIGWAFIGFGSSGEVEGSDYFDCLLQIRQILEKDHQRILCNASRYDVYPSRMSRQMGGGLKAYILTKGRQANLKDLVDIFAPARPEDVGTVEQQKKYYSEWLDSLR